MITQYRESLESIFKKKYNRDGIVLDDDEVVSYLNDSSIRKNNALKLLKKHKNANPNSLPVQDISSNLISISFNYDFAKYARIIDASTRELLVYNTSSPNTNIIVDKGYLGYKVFGGNIVIFDPRPNFVKKDGERSIFPTYNPIYSKTTKDDILEYIYTTEYPSDNIPPFPNFKIGEFVVDGAKYNPLFDKRNYRLNGSYNSNGDFVSMPLVDFSASFTESSILDRGGHGAFLLTSDIYNKGFQNVYGDEMVYKIKGSGFKFKKLTPELLDYNKTQGLNNITLGL